MPVATTTVPSPARPMPAFDLVVVGSGGGPSETDISAYACRRLCANAAKVACFRYLLKARDANWRDGIIGIEAGTWPSNTTYFVDLTVCLGSGLGALKRILELKPDLLADECNSNAKPYSASQIYSFVRCVDPSALQ